MTLASAVAEALRAVQDAAWIACLVGDRGATLAWQDEAAPWMASWDDLRRWEGSGLEPEQGAGATWGEPPSLSCFVQLDYEWPGAAARILPTGHVARFDAAGITRIDGPDEGVRSWMRDRLAARRPAIAPPSLASWAPQRERRHHLAGVRTILDRIAAGDHYQVNLGLPIAGAFAPAPHRDLAAFIALITHSPAPFAGFFRSPLRPSVVSHSPECLLAARGNELVSVPIKGTRKRVPGSEAVIRAELATAAKDAAELAMIVDLVRNDLGRVCAPGSVRVTDRAVAIDLPYVHHRAARVEGMLAEGGNLPAAVAALFPAGSITGAPKRIAMERIAAIEGSRRGAWCGAFGWIAPGGCDLAVAIRTAEIEGAGIRTWAGSGIVADSDPDAEWDEVLAKAEGMRRAFTAV